MPIPLRRTSGELVNGIGQCRQTISPRGSRGIARQRKRCGGSQKSFGLDGFEQTPADACSGTNDRFRCCLAVTHAPGRFGIIAEHILTLLAP